MKDNGNQIKPMEKELTNQLMGQHRQDFGLTIYQKVKVNNIMKTVPYFKGILRKEKKMGKGKQVGLTKVHMKDSLVQGICMDMEYTFGKIKDIKGNGKITKWMGLGLFNGVMEENTLGNIKKD